MATYIPNATQTTEPTEDRTVESAALEFRTLKSSVNARIDAVQDNVDAEAATREADDLTEVSLRTAADGVLQAQIDAAAIVQANQRLQYLRVPESSVDELPGAGTRAGKALAFDASGKPIAVAVSGTSDPSLRADLAAPTGSALVGFQQAGTGAVARTVEGKLRESVSVKNFGAVGDGLVDDTAAIQACIDANNDKQIVFPTGTYAVSSTINIDSCGCYFVFEKAVIKPIANNFTIFKAVVDAYGVKFFDLIVRGAGTTGVTVFDVFRMVRQGAGIIRCDIDSVETGIFLNGLCYGIDIDAPSIFNVDNPIIVKAAAGAVKINHPVIDMNGKAGVGIDIYGATLPVEGTIPNVGTQIIGGVVEGGTIGIRDASFNTQVYGTYFERNSEADISLVSGSKMFGDSYSNHTAAVGAVAIKARNADAAQIYHPFMANGGRSTGLFDFDGTNTNCYYDVLFGASSFNLPLGVVTGINNQTNKPGPIGGVTRNDGKFSTLSSTGITEFTRSRTASNPLSIATATPTTFLTLPSIGQYEILACIGFSGAPAQYTSTATVLCDGNGARIIANNGSGLTITLSGLNVQVQQTSGITQTVQFIYSRIA